MKAVLQAHLDKTIGLNYESPFKIEAVKLIAAHENYFTIVDSRRGYTHHFSYSSIVQVIESPDGVDVGGLFSHKEHFEMVVKVGHLAQYVPG